MRVLAHRGLWRKVEEKNTLASFERAFDFGHGLEIDIRDQNGSIVVSHDMPVGQNLKFEKFLEIFTERISKNQPLAINIKSDGMVKEIKRLLNSYKLSPGSYFVFDMSIPDAMTYIKEGISVYLRYSDVERCSALFGKAKGIWLDQMSSDWVSSKDVEYLLEFHDHVDIAIVSSELHGRCESRLWNEISQIKKDYHKRLMICTDKPNSVCEIDFN